MRLVIKGFRCYDHYEITFASHITLLQGRTGVGKSTLFQAIAWCLYGSMKNIYPYGRTRQSCSVELTTEQGTILRQTRPEQLRLSTADGTWTDEGAQAEINRRFGSRSVWLATSYLGQNVSAYLLNARTTERLEIIRQICCLGDDPGVIIQNISDRITTLDKERVARDRDYLREQGILEAMITERPPGPATTPSAYEQIVQTLTTLRATLVTLEAEYQQYLHDQGRLESIDQRQAKLEQRLGALPPVDREHLTTLGQRLIGLRRAVAAWPHRCDLATRLETARNGLARLPDMGYLPGNRDDVGRLQQRRQNRDEMICRCEALGYPYDPIAITEAQELLDQEETRIRTHLESARHHQHYQRTLDRYQGYHEEVERLIHQQDQLTQELTSLEPDRLPDLEARIRELEDQHDRFDRETREKQRLHHLQQEQAALERETLPPDSTSDLRLELERLDRRIRLVQSLTTTQENLTRLDQTLQNLETQLTQLRPDDLASLQDQLTSLQDQQKQYRLSQQALTCPVCASTLHYDRGTLTAVHLQTRIDPSSAIEDLTARYRQAQADHERRIELQHRQTIYQEQYDQVRAQFQRLQDELASEPGPTTLSILQEQRTQVRRQEQQQREERDRRIKLETRAASIALALQEAQDNLDRIRSSGPPVPETISTDLATARAAFDAMRRTNQRRRDLMLQHSYLVEALNSSQRRRDAAQEELLGLTPGLEGSIDDLQAALQACQARRRQVDQLVYEPPIEPDPDHLKLFLDRRDLIDRITDLEHQWSKLDPVSPAEIASVPQLEQEYQSGLETLNQQTLLLQAYHEAEEERQGIVLDPDLPTLLETTRTRTSKLEADVDLAAYTLRIQEYQERLEELRRPLDNLRRKIQALTHLRAMAIRVERQLLEQTLVTINDTFQNLVQAMFDEPIDLWLNLQRTPTETDRPSTVTLHLQYKGSDHDSLASLSGGEADRVTLALILALATVSPSPFVLLDEGLRSLDSETRSSCLRAIHRSLPTKNIICIDHEAVIGFYDDVITLG